MHVLMIDDEEDLRKIGRLALEAVGGHRVTLAASGAEGLASARAERPDLVILDMMMPGMDGLHVLAEIRKEPALASVPVVFMTARVQGHEVQEYLLAGAVGVIEKPFDPMKLAADMERMAALAKKA